MTWQTTLLAAAVILWAFVQYGLAVYTLRDLGRRPRVRGNNKVVWALVILGIPIMGALVYTVYGPTSFLRQDRPRMVPLEPLDRPDPVASMSLPTLADDEPAPAATDTAGSPATTRRPPTFAARSEPLPRRPRFEAHDEQSPDSDRVRDTSRSRPTSPPVRDRGGRR